MATSDARELTCNELVELVTDYLEGAMTPANRRRFDEHLESCTSCVTYVEQMRQTIRASGQLSEETIGTQALEALLEHFRKWR